MRQVEIKSPQDPLFARAFALLSAAFPEAERRERDEQERILQKPDYHFTVLMEDEDLIGIILYWEVGELLFLEHLATLPLLRGRGYGARALSILKELGRPILLEIEPPADELTTRRFGFYRRNGFLLNSHHHIQVKYHPGDPDLELKILSYPALLTDEDYQAFKRYMDREIGFGC